MVSESLNQQVDLVHIDSNAAEEETVVDCKNDFNLHLWGFGQESHAHNRGKNWKEIGNLVT